MNYIGHKYALSCPVAELSITTSHSCAESPGLRHNTLILEIRKQCHQTDEVRLILEMWISFRDTAA
jgi:hypothetical protein